MTTFIDIPALKTAQRRQGLNGCGEPLMRHCKHHEEGCCVHCQPAMFPYWHCRVCEELRGEG